MLNIQDNIKALECQFDSNSYYLLIAKREDMPILDAHLLVNEIRRQFPKLGFTLVLTTNGALDVKELSVEERKSLITELQNSLTEE